MYSCRSNSTVIRSRSQIMYISLERSRKENLNKLNSQVYSSLPQTLHILLYEIAQNIIRPSRAAYVHRRLCPHQHFAPARRSSFVTLILLLLLSDTYMHVITLALALTLITVAQRAQSVRVSNTPKWSDGHTSPARHEHWQTLRSLQ